MAEFEFDENMTMESLLDEYMGSGVPKRGEFRTGEIVSVGKNEILVDIGAKSEGVIPADELEELDDTSALAVGNSIRTVVVNPESGPQGQIILSYLKVAEEEDWTRAIASQETGELCQVKSVGANRGGLVVKFGMARGFMPISQLPRGKRINRNGQVIDQLRAFIGEEFSAKVLEVDRSRGRLIVSAAAAEKETRSQRRSERMAELVVGEVYDGRVINLTSFGAFIDLGGVDGLVHLSELSHKHVNKPHDILSNGDDVKVVILTIDAEKQRVALSMKQLEPDPWSMIENIYSVGKLVEVTVTQLTNYGAFARINDDYQIEGLIHISELSDQHIKQPDEVVRKGDKVTSRIIRIDAGQRQIGLSLKRVFDNAYIAQDMAAQEEAAQAAATQEMSEEKTAE